MSIKERRGFRSKSTIYAVPATQARILTLLINRRVWWSYESMAKALRMPMPLLYNNCSLLDRAGLIERETAHTGSGWATAVRLKRALVPVDVQFT